LARQNIPTLYQNPLSSDRFGQQLSQALLADGVQLAQPQAVAQTTSLAVVALNAQVTPTTRFTGKAWPIDKSRQLLSMPFVNHNPNLKLPAQAVWH
jgi:hypothetical protein